VGDSHAKGIPNAYLQPFEAADSTSALEAFVSTELMA